MSAVPIPAGRLVSGVADYDRPRWSPIVLTPRSTVCEVCLTDTEVDVCPAGCLARERGRQRED